MHPYASAAPSSAAMYRVGAHAGSNSPLPPIPGGIDPSAMNANGINGNMNAGDNLDVMNDPYVMYADTRGTPTYQHSQSNNGSGNLATMPRSMGMNGMGGIGGMRGMNAYEREQMQAVHEQEEEAGKHHGGFWAVFCCRA